MSDLNAAAEAVIRFWSGMDRTGAFKSPEKAIDEMQEFMEAPSPREAADVVTALLNWFHANEWDLADYLLVKNEINRQRRWEQLPNGHFQHVEESDSKILETHARDG